MPRVKTTQPEITRDKGQRSLDLPLFLTRILPQWNNPQWVEGEMWRRLVERQPFATICRETLTDNILALDWKIEPKDSEKRDEYKSDIDYHTDYFTDNGEYDYADTIQWVCGDLLDLPFGAAAEEKRQIQRSLAFISGNFWLCGLYTWHVNFALFAKYLEIYYIRLS